MGRHRVLSRALTLETRRGESDGAGGRSERWVPLGTLWAEMRAGSGRDTGGEVSRLGHVSWRIYVRGAPEGSAARPRAGQRFREGDRLFAIRAVAEADTRGAYLTCYAEEEVVL